MAGLRTEPEQELAAAVCSAYCFRRRLQPGSQFRGTEHQLHAGSQTIWSEHKIPTAALQVAANVCTEHMSSQRTVPASRLEIWATSSLLDAWAPLPGLLAPFAPFLLEPPSRLRSSLEKATNAAMTTPKASMTSPGSSSRLRRENLHPQSVLTHAYRRAYGYQPHKTPTGCPKAGPGRCRLGPCPAAKMHMRAAAQETSACS